jgi:hypothetical protein
VEGIITNTRKVYRLVVSVNSPHCRGHGPAHRDPIRTYPPLGTGLLNTKRGAEAALREWLQLPRLPQRSSLDA